MPRTFSLKTKWKSLLVGALSALGVVSGSAVYAADNFFSGDYTPYVKDYNGDGIEDYYLKANDYHLVVAGDIFVYADLTKEDMVLLSDGNGGYTVYHDLTHSAVSSINLPDWEASAVQPAYRDANGDGLTDLYIPSDATTQTPAIVYGSNATITQARELADITTLQPVQGATEALKALAGNEFLYVNPPNSLGISFNKFSSVNLDRPIKLANTPRNDKQTGKEIPSAHTVVIMAPTINLSSVIDVVGPATDVVLIASDDDSSINCNACSFNNTLKLSLISAHTSTYGLNSEEIGNVETTGSISINSLYAPGLLGLDIVAKEVNATGDININQPAMKAANGGYQAVAHGSYKLGTGGIDVINGDFIWNYEDRQIIKATYTSGVHTLEGIFQAPRVQITSGKGLNFKGQVDAVVDAISATSYKDIAHIPQEEVTIQTISKKNEEEGTFLAVGGQIFTENILNLRSTSSLSILSTANISAPIINLISISALSNEANIYTDSIALAGGYINNQGEIRATVKADLWAEGSLVNQWGGVIQAKDVVLTSEKGTILNGSRYPHTSWVKENLEDLKFENSEILNRHTNSEYNHLYQYNTSELGTYYLLPKPKFYSGQIVTLPEETSAHIIGDNVKIQARAVENINPYYERVDKKYEVKLDRQLISQVSISAENSLEIHGGNDTGVSEGSADYFVNASALISLNSPSGLFQIDADKILNQRYRVATYLVPVQDEYEGKAEMEETVDYYMTKGYSGSLDYSMEYTQEEGYESLTAVYSPPGFMMSFGETKFRAYDYFSNILGYVEFFKGFELSDSLNLNHYGLDNQGYRQFEVKAYRGTYSSGTFTKASQSQTVTVGKTVLLNPTDLDALFHVSGGKGFKAPSTSALFETLSAFNYFVYQAAVAKLDGEYQDHHTITDACFGGAFSGADCENTVYDITREYNFVLSDIQVEDNSLRAGKIAVDVEAEWTTVTTLQDTGEVSDPVVNVTVEKKELSLIDVLAEYYDTVKNKLVSLFEEFDWWGEEA